MPRSRALWLRFSVAALLIAGSAFAWKQYASRQTVLDLPTAPVHQGEFSVLITCRGTLIARRSEQIVAPVGVQDLQIVWLAPNGGAIKEGDPVIRFDRGKLEQDRLEKRAALRQAQAALDQGEAQAHMRAEQDKVDLSTARYDSEKAKLEASKQAIVSVSDGQKSAIDQRIAEEKVAVQGASANLHVKSDEAKNASLRRLRDQAAADLARTEHQLSLTELKSPLNGVVTYLSNMSQGWLNAQPFKVGDHVASGAAIAEIPDLSTLEMESKVEETDRSRIAENDAVLVHADAFPEKAFSAKLSRISPLTEQSIDEWPPIGTFRAFASLTQPDPRLRPGMAAAADIIQTKIPNALSIPAKALFTNQGKPVVYVKAGGIYQKTPVTVRARNKDEIAVEGLRAGALVTLVDPELPTK